VIWEIGCGESAADITYVFLDQFLRVAADDENPFALLNERRIGQDSGCGTLEIAVLR
jgi:hypothetical protein